VKALSRVNEATPNDLSIIRAASSLRRKNLSGHASNEVPKRRHAYLSRSARHRRAWCKACVG